MVADCSCCSACLTSSVEWQTAAVVCTCNNCWLVQESVGRWQRLFTGHWQRRQIETLLQYQMLLAPCSVVVPEKCSCNCNTRSDNGSSVLKYC